MATVDYLVNLVEAQADPALAAALGRARQQAPFDRIEWWRALAEECLPGEQPLLAVARHGEAICALPLMRRPSAGQLRSLANWYSFWTRPVFADGGEALLGDIARGLAAQARRVSLGPLAEADAGAAAHAFATAGWTVRATRIDLNHRVAIGGRDFAAYWAARPGALRETVRRKRVKCGVAVRIAQDFRPQDWADYEVVYARSWKPAEGSLAFLRRFAQAEAAAGNLRLGLAHIDGRPVASQLWTVEAGAAFIHKLAHDDAAKAHSPGTLLSHAMFEHAIDRDHVHTIDFGTGDDAYKRDWMEIARPMLRLEMHRPRDPRSWPYLVRDRLKGRGYPLAALQHGG
ncbi:MAG: GNAT family N-acetyltransferase [Novosphingobium sp.]|nr:GNAT family N-acetyltransferase [Novosphingobium sp.]